MNENKDIDYNEHDIQEALNFATQSILKGLDPMDFKSMLENTDDNSSLESAEKKSLIEALQGLRNDSSVTEELDLPNGCKLGAEGLKHSEKGIDILPTPVFVVKTRDKGTGQKVFLNICTSEYIGEPAPRKRLDDNTGKEVEVMNMPVSVGQPWNQLDKTGLPATVYDIVVNPKVAENVQEDRTGSTKDFVCQMAREYVEKKYKCQLDERYKLPKTTIQPIKQRVRDTRSIPSIQEVSGLRVGINKQDTPSNPPHSPPRVLSYRIAAKWDSMKSLKNVTHLQLADTVMELPEHWPNQLVLTVDNICSEACSASFLQKTVLKVSSFEISLQMKGHTSLSILLPYAANTVTAQATVDPHMRELTIIVNVDKTPIDVSPDPGSKPWLLMHALSDQSEKNSGSMTTTNQNDVIISEEEKKEPDSFLETNGTCSEPNSEDELPEDRFHRADIISQYYINTREKERLEKVQRAKSEKEERLNDPSVEYIDFDALKMAGTVTAKQDPSISAAEYDFQCKNTLIEAAKTLEASALQANVQKDALQVKLTSNLWTELLD